MGKGFNHSFARFLDGLDLYEGQCHHVLLEKPFRTAFDDRRMDCS